MGLLPTMIKVIEYSNGSAIYLSGIHPIAYQTQELQKNYIRTIISLMEEKEMPNEFLQEIKLYQIKHYYYQCTNDLEFPLHKYFSVTFNTIYKTLNYGRNILIHCRTGETICVAILIAFFLKIFYIDQQYMIYNILYMIPKSKFNWTDSFLAFIQYFYPQATVSGNLLQQLYEYEKKLEIFYQTQE